MPGNFCVLSSSQVLVGVLTYTGRGIAVSILARHHPDVRDICTEHILSVIMPAHNEEEAIEQTVHEAVTTLESWMQDFEVIVVDDGSKDRTGTLLDAIGIADPRVRILHHTVNAGYGAALVSGFGAANKDLLFFMDSDGQFDIH